MIGVCIPAHDEATDIGACLASVKEAARHVTNEPVRIVVVADACSDDTAAIARFAGCDVLSLDLRCVGAARAAGAEYLLGLGARWMCCTDADTRVPPQWITVQLACGSDAVSAPSAWTTGGSIRRTSHRPSTPTTRTAMGTGMCTVPTSAFRRRHTGWRAVSCLWRRTRMCGWSKRWCRSRHPSPGCATRMC